MRDACRLNSIPCKVQLAGGDLHILGGKLSNQDGKKYYWFKLTEEFFNSEDVRVVRKYQNGDKYVIFWLQLLLKSIKGKKFGVLMFKENIPYDAEKLSAATDTDIDTVTAAMILFKKLGMIDIKNNGEIWLESSQELIGSETIGAIRKRQYRAEISKNFPEGDIVPYNKSYNKSKSNIPKFKKPTIQIIQDYLDEKGITSFDADYFYHHYESKGWLIGKAPMKSWKAAVQTWVKNSSKYGTPQDNSEQLRLKRQKAMEEERRRADMEEAAARGK
jgi:predicted phage replisome organizer